MGAPTPYIEVFEKAKTRKRKRRTFNFALHRQQFLDAYKRLVERISL